MNRFFKIIILLLPVLFLFITGCTNSSTSSPFETILIQQPFTNLTDSIKKEPKRSELYFRRAILLNKNNFPEPALADFKKAWALKKDETYALGVSAILGNKKPDSAILFLNEALKEIPNSFLLQLSLARLYDAQNKTDEALKVYDNLLQENPKQVDLLKMKSDLQDKKGDTTGSVLTLEKAYQLTPYDLDLNYDLADKYGETKNPKAILLCDSLIEKDSLKVHAEPYYFKGLYYVNIDDKSKALTQFNQALQHDYSFLNAYIEKGKILYAEHAIPEALKVFQLANKISAVFPDAYYWMGKREEALGQNDAARLNYQRAYGLDKTFTQAKEAAERVKN